MKQKIISENNLAAWKPCTLGQMIRMLGVCNKVKQELKNNRYIAAGRMSVYEAYKDLAEKYCLAVRSYPVYIEDTDNISCFSFDYTNENGVVVQSNEEYPSMSKAQLQSVHETMYLLERRLDSISFRQSRGCVGQQILGCSPQHPTGMATYNILKLLTNETSFDAIDTLHYNNNNACADGR